jgi:hypothetical protein
LQQKTVYFADTFLSQLRSLFHLTFLARVGRNETLQVAGGLGT